MLKRLTSISARLEKNCQKNLYKTQPRKIERIQPTMVLAYTNLHGIKKILENLKPKQSTGHDDISNEIPECCLPLIERHLTILINKCIEDRTFPETIKISKVIPIFKNGDQKST